MKTTPHRWLRTYYPNLTFYLALSGGPAGRSRAALFSVRATRYRSEQPFLFYTLASLLLSLLPVVGWTQGLTATNGTALTVQSGAVLYVAGGVQNLAGSTLTNAGTVQLAGDLTNAGTLTSTGTLLFSGSQDQTFTPSGASVSNLTLRNTGGAGANHLLLASDLTVSSLLTLTQGLVRTQGNASGSPLFTLSLPDAARVVGEAAGQYVQGRLAVTRNSVNASTAAVDFTNGIVLNANGQDLGLVTVTRTAGLQAAGVSYGTNVGGTSKGIDRLWQVVTNRAPSPTAPASVTVSWVADDDNGFNPATPVQLWRAGQATGPWTMQGTAASASARSFTANVTQLGVLTVSNTSQPLPVTLVAFAAQRQGSDGLLSWTTASELNSAYFQVESSADGTAFQALGQVAGAGTSSQAHSYQFTDPNLARYGVAQLYYRLHQVDGNGTSAYSSVRTLAVPLKAELLVQAYPNPSTLGARVALSFCTDQVGTATLKLSDVLGRVVIVQQAELLAGTSSLPLVGAAELATGVYVLHVQQGNQQRSFKLVRQ